MKLEDILKEVALEQGFSMEDHEFTMRSLRSSNPGWVDQEIPPEQVAEVKEMCAVTCEVWKVARAFLEQERELN